MPTSGRRAPFAKAKGHVSAKFHRHCLKVGQYLPINPKILGLITPLWGGGSSFEVGVTLVQWQVSAKNELIGLRVSPQITGVTDERTQANMLANADH